MEIITKTLDELIDIPPNYFVFDIIIVIFGISNYDSPIIKIYFIY